MARPLRLVKEAAGVYFSSYFDDRNCSGERLVADTSFQTRRVEEAGPVKIEVFDNQIEPALKALKKEMLKSGLFKEMKRRAYYEKPSVKRKRKQAEARKKRRKTLRRSQSDHD